VEHLEQILEDCGSLRGVKDLPHRTLVEFNWFIQAIIFNNDLTAGIRDYLAYYIKKAEKERITTLIEWARLFREYCEETYR
jgi:hypothetical protein